MLRSSLALLVAQSSALSLQPLHARGVAAVRGAAAVRNAAAAMMAEAIGDSANPDWPPPELVARLRQPIRQADGGWADTAGRYGGKKNTNVNGEVIEGGTHYGTGGGKRLDDSGSEVDDVKLPADKQALCVLPDESFKIEKMEMSQTDEDHELVVALEEGQTEAEMFIDIEPMFLTKTEYFYGFTEDSSDLISIDHGMSSDIEGEMNAKDHNAARVAASRSMERGADTSRIMIKLKFKPVSKVGEYVAYLCFIFPEEKNFSRFYKITGICTDTN